MRSKETQPEQKCLPEFEMRKMIERTIDQLANQIHQLQFILEQMDDYKRNGYKLECSLVNGVPTFKPVKKEMGYKTK